MTRKIISLILIGMLAVCLMAGNALASDEDCIIISSTDTAELTATWQDTINQVWGKIVSRIVAYDSLEGKEWINRLGIKFIPYVIFTKKIEESDKFFEFAKKELIGRKSGVYVIPDNMLMSSGPMLFGREKRAGQLDIFVMSQCPAGNDALRQIGNYLDMNPGAIQVTCHYITTFREFGIDSLHGPGEIREDINRLLIKKYYPEKFWLYLAKYRETKDFTKAAKEAGIEEFFIAEREKEGLKLLEEDSNLCKELGVNSSPSFLWENRMFFMSMEMVSKVLPRHGSNLPSREEKAVIPIIVLYSRACPHCDWFVNQYAPKLKEKFGDRINFEYYDTGVQKNFEKKLELEKKFGIVGGAVPQVFIGERALAGRQEIESKLEKAIEEEIASSARLSSGLLAMTEGARPDMSRAESREGPKQSQDILLTTFRSFTPLAVITAGFLDGINPCAFSTIVFFLSFLAVAGYNRRRIILVGAVFTLAVFLTYLGLGLGAFAGLQQLRAFNVFSKYFDIAVGALTIILGAVSLYDYIRFRRTGQAKDMILKLPDGIKNTIHQSIGGLRGAGRTALIKVLLIAFGVGVVVSLLESICTGQIYLPTITFILKMKVVWWRALRYLILYNVMFILPLIVVLVLTLYGIGSDWWQRQMQHNLGKIKLVTALLFFSLGIFILLWR